MDKTGKLHLTDIGIDNMTNLVELSDQSLLNNLQIRYSQKLIYTYIGSILISINPYTELGIYDKKHIEAYQNKSLHDMPPHLFGIGEINFSKMMMENENQVIVISGESGAGKTECFKRLLKYFAHVSGGVKESKSQQNQLTNDIATKILDSTPLLESFGNAQTIRNDNSSRFGKYVEIFFENGSICGSKITNYLLEKSRIVHINSKERGYHIFYEILQGLDSFSKSQYCFKNVSNYTYLNNSKTFTLKDRNDATNLTEFMNQWSSLGMTSEDMDVTMRILSAVLHLGNIKFMEEEEASYLVETENIGIVAKMLKVDQDSLKHCLTMKTTETVKDASSSPLSVEQSINYRDTLAKHLYSELFNWIVSKVNLALNQTNTKLVRQTSMVERSLISPTSNLRCIAMLDIYGFENFPENSLEQVCINYANETLQQFFNRYVFELEQAEYKQEGISWHYISYPDNQPIIDLLSAKPNGIIQILNDECSIPQGTDETFLNKCHNVHSKHPNYEKPKQVHPPKFIIHHFAGKISYTVTGFLEKNRDVLRKEILNVIEHCDVEEIANIFKRKRELQAKNPIAKARTPAVMGDFQNSLSTLLTKMKTCQPWFIRCLKPNVLKEAMNFNKDIVMDQMKYTGILETVKIRKSGFPIRIPFNVFLSRFYLLVTKEIRKASQGDQQEACLKLMMKFKGQKSKHFEIGKTKLFLRETFARHLESQVRIIRNRSAIIIQRNWRAYWKIKFIIIQNLAATKIQSVVRGFLDRIRIKKLRRGILKLQSFVRMQLVRKQFLEDNPQFLRYAMNHEKSVIYTEDQSKLTTYKMPVIDNLKKGKKNISRFNYDLLKIPIELAFIFESTGSNQDYGIPPPESIIQTGRAQHLWNRSDYKLPEDVDEYLFENLLDEYGNGVSFEPKFRPITIPFFNENGSSEVKDNALIAHKLILRILYADAMPWPHRYLTTSYLLFMGTKSAELQREIFVQIIAETLPEKSTKQKLTSNNEENRMLKAWTLLGNYLSYIIPSSDSYNYVLKFVSDCFGVDQAVTCQEKLLHHSSTGLPQIPRLFPITNLEYRANQKGAKTCLNIVHPDNITNSVHLNSFTIAEDIASHSLCFRLKRYRLMKGWSISVIFPDQVLDCGGFNYVFDLIAGLELPQRWSEISGQSVENNFLISRRQGQTTDLTEMSPRGFVKNVNKRVYNVPSTSKNLSTLNSLNSMDRWVENVFDSSFRLEDTNSIPYQDFIHGLEDEIRARNQANPQIYMSNGVPNLTHPVNSNLPISLDYNLQSHPPSNTFYFPAASNNFPDISQDPIFLQEQLNNVELENKVIQSSIEKELLQSRLHKLQQQKYAHNINHNPNIPFAQPYQQFPTINSYPNPAIINPYQFYTPYNNNNFPYQFSYNANNLTNGLQNSQPNNVNGNNTSNEQYLLNPNFKASQLKEPSSSVYMHSESFKVSRLSDESSDVLIPKVEQPSLPQPPPPPANGPPKVTNLDQTDSENSKTKKAETKIDRKKSIVKYSEIGEPSKIIVDDSTILPIPTEEQEKKSYQRAAEVPKVDVNNRTAILEKFFKEKPMTTNNTNNLPKKRPVPIIKTEENVFPENQASAINLLASMNSGNKILPRPSIYSQTKPDIVPTKRKTVSINNQKSVEESETIIMEKQLPRTNVKKDNIDFQTSITKEAHLPRENLDNLKSIKKIKKYISNKNAIILNGLPDMRYYTYQRAPWYILLKREIYLPNEIQNTTMLNPMIFCQIVRDLIEFPCIRWVGNEKQRLISLLGTENMTKDINKILSVPSNLMLQIINEAQNCELYFSRFISIQLTTSQIEGISNWLAISHTGIRFVEQNNRSTNNDLVIGSKIVYSNVSKVHCKELDQYNNPTLLCIKTRLNKKYKMRTVHASSAKSLILEFLSQYEIVKSHGTLNLSNNEIYSKRKPKKRHLLEENKPFTDSGTMMLGVNNERIEFHKLLNLNSKIIEPKHSYETIKKQGNLIEFINNYSKYKDRKMIENVVLRFQRETIMEPILPFINNGINQQALELHKLLIRLSVDPNFDQQSNIIEIAQMAFKIVLQNIELKEEFILQLFKQINGNPNSNARNFIWNLLSIVIVFVGPSQRIQPYLLEHLNQILRIGINEDQHLAAYIMKILKMVCKYGPRKEMPLVDEFQNLMKGIREDNVTIYMSNEAAVYNLNYHDKVEDVVNTICQTMNISMRHETIEYSLALAEINKINNLIQIVEFLKTEIYFFDIYNSILKNKKQNSTFRFIRMSWIAPLNVEYRIPTFIKFSFNQLSKDILNESWLIPQNNQTGNDKDLLKIAKIAYFSMRGQGLEKPKHDDVLNKILPTSFFENKKGTINKKQIIKMINSEMENSNNKQLSGLLEYQKKFLELVESLPRFGRLSFNITQIKDIAMPGPFTLNFDMNSIFFFDDSSQIIILKFSISEFESFTINQEDKVKGLFTIFYKANEKIQFYSNNVIEITVMLNQYLAVKMAKSSTKP